MDPPGLPFRAPSGPPRAGAGWRARTGEQPGARQRRLIEGLKTRLGPGIAAAGRGAATEGVAGTAAAPEPAQVDARSELHRGGARQEVPPTETRLEASRGEVRRGADRPAADQDARAGQASDSTVAVDQTSGDPASGDRADHASAPAATVALAPEAVEAAVLGDCGLGADLIAALADDVEGAAEAAIGRGLVDEAVFTTALARRLGLVHATGLAVAPNDVLPSPAHFARAGCVQVGCVETASGPRPVFAMAPRGGAIAALARTLALQPAERDRVLLATRAEIRRAMIEAHREPLVREAVERLWRDQPDLSAAGPLGAVPTLLWSVGLALWIALIAAAPDWAAAASASLFIPAGLLRLAAADRLAGSAASGDVARPEAGRAARQAYRAGSGQDDPGMTALPRYAVLVALYRENAGTIAGLVAALQALDYPRRLLQIRLVVEADDGPTIAAATRAIAGTAIELVEVPPAEPRTKPKALAFALSTVEADLVAVFDAEDRPDPRQLLKAANRFAAAPDDVIALQAALVIDHDERDRPWLVRQFELEYASLFRGLLPHLAAIGRFLPLGGTSNHFRYRALVEAGGWDPHNVTEDADLAARLTRRGGRIEVFDSWTFEEAPTRLAPWFGQRSRWFKGWMQTWIVHSLDPSRARREMGTAAFLLFQAVIGLGIISPLLFLPTMIGFGLGVVGVLPLMADRSPAADLALAGALVAAGLGFTGAIRLAVAARRREGHRPRLLDVATMPFYWALMSIAAYAALVELGTDPHRWRKTAHGIARRPDGPRNATRSVGCRATARREADAGAEAAVDQRGPAVFGSKW